MKRLLSAVVLLSLGATTPLAAQSFGDLFPLTNTRYRTAFGLPHLRTNGSDFFLFWTSDRKIRATQLIEGEPRAGHVILDVSAGFDVAWTGERFMAVTTRSISSYPFESEIVGRFLDAKARPVGSERVIAQHGSIPRVAAGPESVLLVYRDTNNEIRSLPLAADGGSTGAVSVTIAPKATGYAVAANANGFIAAIADSTEIRAVALDVHGQTIANRTLTHGDPYYREVSVATDGTNYVAVWCEERAVVAITIDRNGTFGAPLVIDSSTWHPRTPTVVWNGAGWTITYEGRGSVASRTRVVQLDREAQGIVAEEESAEGLGSPSVAALDGRIVAAWAPAQYPGGASVIDLPLAANQPRVATYAATQQTLLATASSANATLMVWSELGEDGRSIHTGVRTNDGQWIERELATDGFGAVAASDGTRFAVIVRGSTGQVLIRLDERGRPLAPPVSVPGYEAVIAWNGAHYALITSGANLEGRLLSPSGALSAPVKIPRDPFNESFGGKLALASNGDGFLLAGETIDCQFLLCVPRAMKAMRLRADLQHIDAEITLDSEYAELGGAVWNGSEYVVIWKGSSDGLFTARIPAAAASPFTIAHTDTDIFPRSVAAMPGGSVAIVGSAGSSKVTRVAFLRNDGSIAQSFAIDSATVTGTPLLTSLPGGVAYVASSFQDAAPHHGTSHVMMAIARSSVPPPPYPPHVHARLQNGAILVDWSASAGTLNGYRLEYRVDNGSWNELEEWFPPDSHHRVIRPTFGTNFEIRMRAFNDGGVSAYSATALTKPTRRRAAR